MSASRCGCFDVAYYAYIILISEFPAGRYPGGCCKVSEFFEVLLEQFSWETCFEGNLLVVNSEEVAGKRFFVSMVEDVNETVDTYGGVEGREADAQSSCWSKNHFSVGGVADMHGFQAPFE